MSKLQIEKDYKILDIAIGSIAVLTLGFGLVIPKLWGLKKMIPE